MQIKTNELSSRQREWTIAINGKPIGTIRQMEGGFGWRDRFGRHVFETKEEAIDARIKASRRKISPLRIRNLDLNSKLLRTE